MSFVMIAIAAVAVSLLAWVVVAYDRLLRLRNQLRTPAPRWTCSSLVPSLLTPVQACAGHVQAALTSVTGLKAPAPGSLDASDTALEQNTAAAGGAA